MKINQIQLRMLCEIIAKNIWGDGIKIPITISNRLRTTMGKFIHVSNNSSFRIPKELRFADYLVNGEYKIETIIDVIKHELCHYHLYMSGSKSYGDKEYEFEKELKRIGSTSTRVINHAGTQHIGKCCVCDKISTRGTEKKVRNHCSLQKNWISSCCKAKMYYAGTESFVDNSKQRAATDTTIVVISEDELNKILSMNTKFINAKTISNKPQQCASQEKTISEILRIEDVVPPGAKGVTRTQVHPAVEKAVDEKNPKKLALIKKHYPEYYRQVCMYISKKRLSYIESL